jgi:hypothetical protein
MKTSCEPIPTEAAKAAENNELLSLYKISVHGQTEEIPKNA